MLKNCDIELLKRISIALNSQKSVTTEDCRLLSVLVEHEIDSKKAASERAKAFNKTHRKQHNESNKRCPYYQNRHNKHTTAEIAIEDTLQKK